MCNSMKKHFDVLPAKRRAFSSLVRHLRNCEYREYNEISMLVGKVYFTVDCYVGETKNQYVIAAFNAIHQRFMDNRTFNADLIDSEEIIALVHFNPDNKEFEEHGADFMNRTVMQYALELVAEEQVKLFNSLPCHDLTVA